MECVSLWPSLRSLNHLYVSLSAKDTTFIDLGKGTFPFTLKDAGCPVCGGTLPRHLFWHRPESWTDGGSRGRVVFWMLSFKPTFSLSSFTFIKRLFSSSLSAIRRVSSAYLRLSIFLLAILILETCASSSPAFHMMYSAYKLISRVTIYSLDLLLSQFGTSLLSHVCF